MVSRPVESGQDQSTFAGGIKYPSGCLYEKGSWSRGPFLKGAGPPGLHWLRATHGSTAKRRREAMQSRTGRGGARQSRAARCGNWPSQDQATGLKEPKVVLSQVAVSGKAVDNARA